MPPETALPRGALPLLERVPAHWRAPLVQLGAAWLGLIALFFGDWRDIARQAWDSSTYNHILLIPPILAWLVMQRCAETTRLMPRAWWPFWRSDCSRRAASSTSACIIAAATAGASSAASRHADRANPALGASRRRGGRAAEGGAGARRHHWRQ